MINSSRGGCCGWLLSINVLKRNRNRWKELEFRVLYCSRLTVEFTTVTVIFGVDVKIRRTIPVLFFYIRKHTGINFFIRQKSRDRLSRTTENQF